MDGCSYIRVNKLQAVLTVGGGRLVGKTEVIESTVEPVSRPVAGKNPPRPVSSVCGGSEADNQYLRVRRSEAWDRSSPIVPVAESSDFRAGNVFAVYHQAGAAPAVDNISLGCQLCHSSGLS